MYRCNHDNMDSKHSLTALMAVTGLIVIGFVSSSCILSNNLYTTTTKTTQSVAVRAVAPGVAGTQVVARPTGYAEEQGVVPPQRQWEAPQASLWAPVAALIALPTAIAIAILRRHQLGTAGVAAAMLASSTYLTAMPALAGESVMGLEPCSSSKKFEQRKQKEVKALEKREKLYEAGSAPFQALEKSKEKTLARFAKYADQGFLCGADGLPHLIAEPGLAVKYGHAGETLIPTIGFLYVAGYIGTTGRTYLQEIRSRQKPTQSEIIIDVPLATSIALKSWDWPNKAVKELATGTLLEDASKVPVSRR